jgi:hypothetical protein
MARKQFLFLVKKNQIFGLDMENIYAE